MAITDKQTKVKCTQNNSKPKTQISWQHSRLQSQDKVLTGLWEVGQEHQELHMCMTEGQCCVQCQHRDV